MRALRSLLIALAVLAALPSSVSAIVPAGFQETTAWAGLVAPTSVRFDGDGSQGRIDEVRVYNRALAAADIQADMSRPAGSASLLALSARPRASRAHERRQLRRARRHASMRRERAPRHSPLRSHPLRGR